MNGIDRLHGIAEDVGRTVWLRDLGAALHDTLDAIEREARDPSGYESDVLAWVEENGGLDAVRERLMPEGMSWPFYEDGEPVRIGEYVICDERCSPAAVDFIEFNESGFKLYGESGRLIAGSDMPCGERVKRPAPPVLDADGGEIRVGDEVWSTTGEFDGKRTVSSVHIDPDEPPYAMFEERQKPYSYLCCCLTHRAPVLAADARPLHEGEHVYHVETGAELVVKELPKPGEYQAVVVFAPPASHLTSFDPDQLTHQRPALDADGVPIKVGDTVYLLPGEWCGEYPLRYYSAGDEMVVKELYPDHEYEGVLKCAGDGKCTCFPLPCQLTHTKPEPDSWSSVWADVSNGNESPEGMMRRCRALAERGQ